MSSSKFAIIDTEYGPVKGIRKSTVLGRDFFNFYVPYMKAPLGNLRFREAQPPEKWIEPLDISNDERPSYCTFNYYTMEVGGKEDAGIVSIYTPYLTPRTPLPVAVYIHGGGFQFGYGAPDIYGCDYMLQKDVILVNINYRVGIIGFLSLEDPELNIPGNVGLKDQVFALKWIQRNIANFGGDPNNVTLFGTSVSSVFKP